MGVGWRKKGRVLWSQAGGLPRLDERPGPARRALYAEATAADGGLGLVAGLPQMSLMQGALQLIALDAAQGNSRVYIIARCTPRHTTLQAGITAAGPLCSSQHANLPVRMTTTLQAKMMGVQMTTTK